MPRESFIPDSLERWKPFMMTKLTVMHELKWASIIPSENAMPVCNKAANHHDVY